MEFAILGPLRAVGAQGPINLKAPKQRALLAALLLAHRDDVVSAERLVDAIWGDAPPATAGKALQVHVSQLRRVLGPDQPIVTLPSGYAVRLDAGALDLERFQELVAGGRRARADGDAEGAARQLREALALFRGAPLADVPLFGTSAFEGDRLAGLRLAVLEERLELDLERGEHAAVADELRGLVEEHPYRERLHAQYMLALYRSGRQAEALEAFRRARRSLVDDLGLEPAKELQRLEAAILAQDAALDLAAAAGGPARAGDGAGVAGGGPAGSSAGMPRRAAGALELPVPVPPTPLVGREDALAAAAALILEPGVRLLTLTGPGGIGKTRLALELARRLASSFEHGSGVVPLAAVRDPEHVLPALVHALGLSGGDGRSPFDVLTDVLADRSVLLVIDNFEQVLEAAPEVSRLLGAAPGLKLVVTSRAVLRVAGEHELAVPPLAPGPAVELFMGRAQARDPGAPADADDRERIEGICRRLDGLPLAIELAAARSKVLTPAAILDRLERRLDLLSAGARDAPVRHQALRATIDWSYDLLDRPSRTLWGQLGVFVGGWTLETAEAVCGPAALDGLGALADQSLVARSGDRFAMLETLREYALERLDAQGDGPEMRLRHARAYLDVAVRAERGLTSPEARESLARLDADRDNLHAAVGYALAGGDVDTAQLLCGSLWRFWLTRGQLSAGRQLVAAALAAGRGDARARLQALNAAGILAGEEGDLPAAKARFLESLALAREVGDDEAINRVGDRLGTLALYEGDHEEAIRRYEESLGVARALGDDRVTSLMLHNLASAHEGLGERERAIELLGESVAIARRVADPVHLSSTLRTLGRVLLQVRRESPEALALLQEGLTIAHDLDERPGIVECLDTLAGVAGRAGDAVTGALLLGAADVTREASGAVRQADEMPWIVEQTAALRGSLGEEGYAAAVERGRRLTIDEAVAHALAVAG